MTEVPPIPEKHPRLTPYLSVRDAGAAILFYTTVFGAREQARMSAPDGSIAHAELEIGGSLLMLAEAVEEIGFRDPKALGGTPVILHLYVEDVDRVYNRALHEGATAVSPAEDQFYGDRTAQLDDPFGHRWNIATHVEDVPPEELSRRATDIWGE